jgi:long-chain acyl-CoA synthetase
MTHRWLTQYPAGVPAQVDITQYASIVELLEESFEKFAAADSFIFAGSVLTYGDIDTLSKALAAWLQAQGLVKGDCVAIMLPNLLSYPVAASAVLRAGCIAVNVNPLYTPRELSHQLVDSGAKVILILEPFLATLNSIIANTSVKTVLVAGGADLVGLPRGSALQAVVSAASTTTDNAPYPRLTDAIAQGARLDYKRPVITPSDVAVLQYTGGTTGISKGATLLHQTIIANLLASEAWMQPGLKRLPMSTPLTIVCALPLYHVFAFICCGLLGMRAGGRNILIANPRDLGAMIQALKPYKLHMFPAVNTLFNGLVHHPDFIQLDFSELQMSNGGGTAVQEAVAAKWLAATGCPIVEGYGLSETSAGATANPTNLTTFSGTIGVPMPNIDIKVLDDDGTEVPLGERGEICIKGPQVMPGYWKRPEETAASFTADGFFKSGDIGVMDERGYLRIVDRKKDMILVSGFNVYPNEVEAVVAGHPGVLECAVVGVPDAVSGEAVRLFVVKKAPSLTAKEVTDFCAAQLTGYKRPRSVVFLEELPKTNVGKILRRELRDKAVNA